MGEGVEKGRVGREVPVVVVVVVVVAVVVVVVVVVVLAMPPYPLNSLPTPLSSSKCTLLCQSINHSISSGSSSSRFSRRWLTLKPPLKGPPL